MKHWYAIFCKPRQDARATQHLANQHYRVFRPLARVRHRTVRGFELRVESLFPRYLFIRLDDCGQSWAPIRSTRGVTGLVKLGEDRAAVVPDAFVQNLEARMAEHGWIDLDAGRTFTEGEKVEVVDGAFAGCEALYRCRSGADRVIVLLNLLGACRQVVLPESVIAKAGA
jgi:transcriptional antiterminator RfaH